MRTNLTRWSLALIVIAFSGMAQAHPGHEGGYLAGLSHSFTGLDHLLGDQPRISIGHCCARPDQQVSERSRDVRW